MMRSVVREWVRENMTRRRLRQADIAAMLGITQAGVSLKLAEGEKGTAFTIEEVAILEREFGEASPIRGEPVSRKDGDAIPPAVVRAVVRHIAREYPAIISSPDVAEVILDLCEYAMETNAGGVPRAISSLAMKRVKGIVGG